ncbi:hypothetical protein ACRAWG_20195 [Methylobacterium sp. P31]
MSYDITYSHFSNCFDTQPDQYVTTWPLFVNNLYSERFRRRADEKTKRRTPLISPAAYELGDRRNNENVIGWGSWMGLDIDNEGLLYTPFDMAVAEIEALGLNAVIYTTTKATAACHRFRVLLHLSRDLTAQEIKPYYAAVCRKFSGLAPDPSCKDLSRMYTVPTIWTPSETGNVEPLDLYWSRTGGVPLDIDAVLAEHPPEVSAPLPRSSLPQHAAPIPQPAAKIVRNQPTTLRPLPPGCSLLASPVVTSGMIEDYINSPKGSHHTGLYRFMTRVAARAAVLEFEITVEDLVAYAREVDVISPIKTATTRWARSIYTEAARALEYAGPH